MTTPLVRLSGITRRFGSVTALDGAELELRTGEIHGVLGENGAGKTTLFNILAGMLRPDDGRVEIDGEAVTLTSPRDAWRRGIGMVHQHFKLVSELTVLENLALGMRSAAGGFGLPYARVRRRVEELAAETGLRVALDRRVGVLGVGERQRVEILKALLREPRMLVLDEPTAVLTPGEVERLFALFRRLAEDGRGVAVVAHKLDEVMAVSDRYTVLRAGRTVFTGARGDIDASGLVKAMVGGGAGAVEAAGPVEGAGAARPGRTARATPPLPHALGQDGSRSPEPSIVARLEGVGVREPTRGWVLRGASMEVRRGEIVGVAGVEGNGQRELARILAGRLTPDEGSVALLPGIGFVPQDRTHEGLVQDFDLTENVALSLHDASGGWRMPWALARERAEDIRTRFGVRAPSVHTLASALSGGNQQRMVVGRELAMGTDLLVAENPTRGLDIAATRFVRARLAERGPGTVLISSDLEEVLALCDRIFVMVRGRLVPVPDEARDREAMGRLMLTAGA